ncbi:ABC transporter [Trichoderma velutinum]
MDLITATCPSGADASFGPRVNAACRGFDFTIQFEDLLLACLPSSLFLLLLPLPVWHLWKVHRCVKRSTLLFLKLATIGCLLAYQITFLILRASGSHHDRTHASLAADILQVISVFSALILSYINHCRSIRPSTILVLYLSARTIADIVRVRTLWLIPEARNSSIVLTLSLIFTLIALVSESMEKDAILRGSVKKPGTPEPFSGFWKQATFAWLATTFRRGYTQVLSVDDLPDLDPKLDSGIIGRELAKTWASTRDKSAKYALFRVCLNAYLGPFLSAVLPRLCLTAFTFCQPFLINAIVTWVGSTDASMAFGKGLIGATALTYVGMAVSTALYEYRTIRFVIRLRGGLISLIHGQTARARGVDLGNITAIALMGTDVERITVAFRYIHEVWACCIDIAIAVYLLERQVGVACVMPVVIILVFIGATLPLSASTSTAQRLWVEKVEDRLRLTSHVLENIKAVKMLGLSEKLSSIIQGLRHAEIVASAAFRKLLIWRIVLSQAPTDLAPIATFTLYVVIALIRKDNSLLAAQAFTSLSLVSLLTTPVLTLIQSIPAVIQCMGCFDRMQEYCSVPYASDISGSQVNRTESFDGPSVDLEKVSIGLHPHGNLVEFHNQNFGWKEVNHPVLRNVDLSIKHGAFTAIVGPVGSGKSTFLESILGESLATEGSTERNFATIGYCSQTPWLQSHTVRENIVGNMDFDKDWYRTVIWACGLEEDLSRLAQGDKTPVGSNGLKLSGGQKQRIGLARALYSRCRVVLLDDVFSGVDAVTTEKIVSRLFEANGLFRNMRTTVVFTTHSSLLLPYADQIIVLADGQVFEKGVLKDLIASSSYIQAMKVKTSSACDEELVAPDKKASTCDSSPIIVVDDEEESVPDSAESTLNDLPEDDTSRQKGDFSDYIYYLRATGFPVVVGFLGTVALWAFCRQFPTVWVDWWTAANEQNPEAGVGMYLGIYAFLGVIGVIFMICACWLMFINMVSKSSLRLHEDVLNATLKAPFQFFQLVDIGNITNRFSRDMDLVDMDLPMQALNFIAATGTCTAQIVILAVYAKYLAITIPFVAGLVYVTQKFYLRTSRQLRLLDIEAKAPLYTHFLELVAGAVTVRAFGWQAAFDDACVSLLNFSQRPVYLLNCIQQCLQFFLDMMVAVVTVALMAMVVFMRDSFDPGSVGVALVMVMTFNSNLMLLIRFWTLMETSIGAISRIKSYVATTKPEEIAADMQPLPAEWPSTGSIELSHFEAGHSMTSAPVLKNLTMSISAGEKIAICGPSGSGKTTLALSLLRMVEIQQGSIKIDGVNLSMHSRSEIRQRLNVVTQEPFIMPRDVRFNLDPLQSASDESMVAALQRLGLWELMKSEGGLDMPLRTTSWSAGQRQLLCLARAMVRKGKVLILDEAASSVDNATEETIQDIIESEFATHTVLAVLHRLRYIHRYDRVAVLDAGVLVEFDTPTALLSRDSRFAKLYHSGNHT